MRSLLLLGLATVVVAGVAFEARAEKKEKPCVFRTTRIPCSDAVKDDALRPYGMKETDDAFGKAGDEAACLAEGNTDKVKKIARRTILKSKATTILFNGKEIGKVADTSDCK